MEDFSGVLDELRAEGEDLNLGGDLGSGSDPVAGADPAAGGHGGLADPAADPAGGSGAAEVDPAEAMWGDLTPEPAPDAAAAPPAVPEEFQKVLGLTDYVREPAHVEAAVRTAAEVWDVVSGKSQASQLLEGMRAQNPQQYEKTIREDIIPYIEKITGQKFGGEGAAAAPDPVAAMRAELEQLKLQPQIEAQQRAEQAQVQQAYQATEKTLKPLIDGGNGVFEGDMQGAMSAIAAQLPKLGLTSADLMKQVLAGNMANVEKAYKAAEKAKTLEVKAYADRIKARFTKLKGSVPAAKGASSTGAAAGSDKADLSTQAGRAKWMTQQFQAGAGE